MSNAMEQLEREFAAKRAKLERELALAAKLPTNGRSIHWIGENGWDEKGAPRNPIGKECELLPWIFHSPTAYETAQHVAYKAPDSHPWTNGTGEHTSSKFRADFVKQYIRAVLNAYAPFEVDIIAVKGRYSSHFPAGFEYSQHRDYADAKELARGRCKVTVTTSIRFTSTDLEIYADVPDAGPVKVSISNPPQSHALSARPRGVHSYRNGPVYRVDSWIAPEKPAGCVNVFSRGSGDYSNTSRTLEYLFDSVASALTALGI